MNLKRQLLLVSLLTLVLPWAGCEFIRETESALRAGQQQMLAGTARAIAESLQQYAEDFPAPEGSPDFRIGERLYVHELEIAPVIDGYFNDWPIGDDSLDRLSGKDGVVGYVLGRFESSLYLYVQVIDGDVVYAERSGITVGAGPPFADRISLVSQSPPYLDERIDFVAEAPGRVLAYRRSGFGVESAPTIRGHWEEVAGGYQLEARIPLGMLGTHLGLVIADTDDRDTAPVRAASFSARSPGRTAGAQPDLSRIAANLVQPGMRLLLTDAEGYRIGNVGELRTTRPAATDPVSAWSRFAYDALVERGTDAALAEPDPSGRERQPYIRSALSGQTAAGWFRSPVSGMAVVAVAEPVVVAGETIGAVVLQQGTEEILSLTNQGLSRLLNITLVTTVLVALILLGYATWLSRRIRRLSIAAEDALDSYRMPQRLPSHDAGDEIGALSRSFAHVLRQLGEYNDYLRTLASKLSHELRTPLAIVSSSLDNLEQDRDASAEYTARARDGVQRLQRILAAMSEASRVEELVDSAELVPVDLAALVEQAVHAYRDIYPQRAFDVLRPQDPAMVVVAPELIVQMLDKLIDNAADFSAAGDTITVRISADTALCRLSVENPGPQLPERMRSQLFDSMVSVREGGDDRHMGLGLFIARVIVEGHRGAIDADNTDDGVRFTVTLPRQADG